MGPRRKCKFYDDDGTLRDDGHPLRHCNFAHPSDPDWESAVRKDPIFNNSSNRGRDRGIRDGSGGSIVPRKRTHTSSTRGDMWEDMKNGSADDPSTTTGDQGWGTMVSDSGGRPVGGNAASSGWGQAASTGGNASISGGWGSSAQATSGGWGDTTGGGWGDAAAGSGWGDSTGGWGGAADSGGDASTTQQIGWGDSAAANTNSSGWGPPPPPPSDPAPPLPPNSNETSRGMFGRKPSSPGPSMPVPSTPIMDTPMPAFTNPFSGRHASRELSETPSSMRGSVHGLAPPESIQARHDSWITVIKKFIRAVNIQRKIYEEEDKLERTKKLQTSTLYERVGSGGQHKLDSERSQRKDALHRANAELAEEVRSLCMLPDASSFLSGLDPEPHHNEAQRYLDEVKTWIANIDPTIQQVVGQETAALAQKKEDGEPIILPAGTENLFHRMKELESQVRRISEELSQATSDALETSLRAKIDQKHDDIVSSLRQAQENAMDDLLKDPIARLQQKDEVVNTKITEVVDQITRIFPLIQQTEKLAEQNRDLTASSAQYQAVVIQMAAIDSKQSESDRLLKELKHTQARFEQAFPTSPPMAVYPRPEDLVSALAPTVHGIVHEELKPVLDRRLKATQMMVQEMQETSIAKVWHPITQAAILAKWLEMASSRAAGMPLQF